MQTRRAKFIVFILGLILGAYLIQRADGQGYTQEGDGHGKARCDNFHKTAAEARCPCMNGRACDAEGSSAESKTCHWYCTKDNCKCISECETRQHNRPTLDSERARLLLVLFQGGQGRRAATMQALLQSFNPQLHGDGL